MKNLNDGDYANIIVALRYFVENLNVDYLRSAFLDTLGKIENLEVNNEE